MFPKPFTLSPQIQYFWVSPILTFQHSDFIWSGKPHVSGESHIFLRKPVLAQLIFLAEKDNRIATLFYCLLGLKHLVRSELDHVKHVTSLLADDIYTNPITTLYVAVHYLTPTLTL
jgi:hypothetical protein